jgi:hypothetical protein
MQAQQCVQFTVTNDLAGFMHKNARYSQAFILPTFLPDFIF